MPPYGYLRKSRIAGLTASVAPETQEREVRALAARAGDNPDALILLADWDASGAEKHTRKREGYLRLVQAIESGACTA